MFGNRMAWNGSRFLRGGWGGGGARLELEGGLLKGLFNNSLYEV